MRSLKVVLIDPNINWEGIGTGGGSYPTIALGYMAAIAEGKGHSPVIIHQQQSGMTFEAVTKEAAGSDLVGFSTMAYNHKDTLRLAEEIKKVSPKTVIIVGGSLASGMPELFNSEAIDLIVIGEGEATFEEILDAMSKGLPLHGIAGTASSENTGGELKFGPSRERIKNLDDIPFPTQDEAALIKSRTCGAWTIPIPEQRVASIVYCRGCSGNCEFCVDRVVWGGYSCWRSAENVVDEIEWLVKEHGVNGLQFDDPTFNINPTRAQALCKEIIKRRIEIPWFCFCDPGLANQSHDLLQLMYDAGCRKMGLGIEDPLNRIGLQKRSDNMDRVGWFVRTIDEIGIFARGYYMIGHPDQTEANFKAIEQNMQDLPIGSCRISIYTPLPGTHSWQNSKFLGDPIEMLNKFDTNHLVVKGRYTPDEIEKIRARITRSFFDSPAYQERKQVKIGQGFSAQTYLWLEEFLKAKGYMS